MARISVSLDGSTATAHDAFRRVRGSFRWTLDIIESSRELGLPVQLHTTLCKPTLHDLPAMADLADTLGVVVWAVFCLVPTGRGEIIEELTADEYEWIFSWLVERSRSACWSMKLTEGYHFRRVLQQQTGRPMSGLGFNSGDGIGRAPQAVNAGNGFCFVSHTGDVSPSGFLPLVAGNVRESSVVALYRDHELFRALRDPERLTGKCGRCTFKQVCGGSRSRAYAHTGDLLASDPACAWDPAVAASGVVRWSVRDAG